ALSVKEMLMSCDKLPPGEKVSVSPVYVWFCAVAVLSERMETSTVASELGASEMETVKVAVPWFSFASIASKSKEMVGSCAKAPIANIPNKKEKYIFFITI